MRPPTPAPPCWWRHPALLVALILLFSAGLAVNSLLRDSVTWDEANHLTAGMSYLQTGDFRLAPDHPPLAKYWAALPIHLFVPHQWPPATDASWRDANGFSFARKWLFELNDGQRLVLIGRGMMVVWLMGTLLVTYALGRVTFGPQAGLLALVLAALCPTLLAHGRLVTTDLPITFCTSLSILTMAALRRRWTWPRLLAVGLALAAASVAKLSWPLVLPALLVMAVSIVVGRTPIEVAHGWRTGSTRSLTSRRERIGLALGSGVVVAAIVWLGIWTCYGWRGGMLATDRSSELFEATRARLNVEWAQALLADDHTPRAGLVPVFLRTAQEWGVLPEAYLLGLAQMLLSSSHRHAYLCGEYSTTGWRSYFPIAFAIKTPIATMLLLIAGVAALVMRRIRPRNSVALAGLATFALVYATYVVWGHLNIGHRHLLPLYPVVYVLGGAAVVWTTSRTGRWLLAWALVWLLEANLWIQPHYLAYFNEFAGGSTRGHLYLADSNIDWGQDLLRLADYARRHSDESIKLSYFGSALPTRYLVCASLPSFLDFEPRADLTAGTYVVSVTQLLGVYDAALRADFWNDRARRTYAEFAQWAAAPIPADAPPEERATRAQVQREYPDLRARRLLSRLRDRPPDERIGYSLFVYRLSAADVADLTRP